jgi:hypothetical protein
MEQPISRRWIGIRSYSHYRKLMMFKEIMPHLTFLDIATAPLGLKAPRPRYHARSKAEILEGRSSDQAYENSVDYTVSSWRFRIG